MLGKQGLSYYSYILLSFKFIIESEVSKILTHGRVVIIFVMLNCFDYAKS